MPYTFMDIRTLRFPHISSTHPRDLTLFFEQMAFVISHKSESLDTLVSVLWYLPVQSSIFVVSNCAEGDLSELEQGLASRLPGHQHLYLVHQKDEAIAHLLREVGVEQIVGRDGRVVNGKGEGMYLGVLFATLLGSPKWIAFYDADNFVPSALLEYTLALSKLFLAEHSPASNADRTSAALHNIRICWASKPDLQSGEVVPGVLGRCTRVVSPLFTTLIQRWFGIHDQVIISSNAGEQAFTMETVQAMRFSSGFSVETFHLLELLRHAATAQGRQGTVLMQQYLAHSPHFHEKKDDAHIAHMITDSIRCFLLFEDFLSTVEREVQHICQEVGVTTLVPPRVYPSVASLPLYGRERLVDAYRVFTEATLNLNVERQMSLL